MNCTEYRASTGGPPVSHRPPTPWHGEMSPVRSSPLGPQDLLLEMAAGRVKAGLDRSQPSCHALPHAATRGKQFRRSVFRCLGRVFSVFSGQIRWFWCPVRPLGVSLQKPAKNTVVAGRWFYCMSMSLCLYCNSVCLWSRCRGLSNYNTTKEKRKKMSFMPSTGRVTRSFTQPFGPRRQALLVSLCPSFQFQCTLRGAGVSRWSGRLSENGENDRRPQSTGCSLVPKVTDKTMTTLFDLS